MKTNLLIIYFIVFIGLPVFCSDQKNAKETLQLSQELAAKGWIAYCARSENSTWDIFLARPDGSQKRNLTNTPDFEEAAPRITIDGKKMLYRRIAKGTVINHDQWGFQGCLVIADADGKNPVVFGNEGEYPWASWSPDGNQVVCLTRKGIQIIDIVSKKVIRELPRKGIYQQLFWSQDGKWFTGTGNQQGMEWCVVRMNAESGEVNPVIKFQSCTPDWCPDSQHVIFSTRPKQTANHGYGWTFLMMADGDGQNLKLVYGEEGYHIYGGALSPDGKYVIFTKCTQDGGASETSGAPIGIIRTDDAPVIVGPCEELRKTYSKANNGPVLMWEQLGWEPYWTYAEMGAK